MIVFKYFGFDCLHNFNIGWILYSFEITITESRVLLKHITLFKMVWSVSKSIIFILILLYIFLFQRK